MEIYYHARFRKNYSKRILLNKKLKSQFKKKLKLFVEGSSLSVLKGHSLKGEKVGLRAFSITGDFRVVYRQISKTKVLFLDIGKHSQVY